MRTASIVSNRFLFTGREYAANFGFYEYRARAYHPGLGRFMSEDPKLFVHRAGLGKAPDDWSFTKHPDEGEFNLFRYCGNDPIDFTDPTGNYYEVQRLDPSNYIVRIPSGTTVQAIQQRLERPLRVGSKAFPESIRGSLTAKSWSIT
jgi:RHS repeat-associated protein